jgi:hypothetical protein
MNEDEKHIAALERAFEKAVEELPDSMDIRDLVVFFCGLCTLYKLDISTVGAILLSAPDYINEQDAPVLNFKDEKLDEMFRGDVNNAG